MMQTYIITAHYATWTGHMASCRREVEADSHSDAMDAIAARIRTWKRYMGKLSMDCIRAD